MKSFITNSKEETIALAEKLAKELHNHDIIFYIGGLGMGKTAFTQGLCNSLGIQAEVVSPTFAIVNEYEGRLPLYHYDVYRISCEEEMEDTGYEDYFYGEGVCLVEWAELVKDLIPQDAIWITVEKDYTKDDDYRLITIRQEG